MSSGTSASIRGKNSDPTELRIVLIGGRREHNPSGKSSVGNIILGRDVFDTKRRTAKSIVRQELVSGRKVTVVNTPGWKSAHPLDLTPKQTQLEIQQSVFMCPPAPNAFFLVMPLDTTDVGTGMSVEEHMSLLGEQVWSHTSVVFTVADEEKIKPGRDLIRSDDSLRSLTQKCEGRYHVLNISDSGDRSEGTKLLEKLDHMVTSNVCHYETEKHVLEGLEEIERAVRTRAEQRRADAQKQTTGLPKDIGMTDCRILLMGQYWSGKSSTGNTILGESSGFKVGQGSEPCQVRHGDVAGRHVTVVDVPGWYCNSPVQDTSEMDKLEIQNCMCLCPPGPHAVLLLVPVDEAFTSTKRVAVEEHMALLPQGVWSHTIALFTSRDRLGDTSIEQHIETEGENLRWLVEKCGNRYHVFNKKNDEVTQVTGLLEKIEQMVAVNRGGHYVVDGDVSEKFSERKSNVGVRVHTFMTRARRQRTALKALLEGEHQSLPDVRVMLVGGKKSGRNAAGNFILQESVFTEDIFKEFKTQSKPQTECVRQQRRVGERNVSVVNCPDWSTTPPSQKINDVLQYGLALSSPGPHAVLLTVSAMSSFSEADRRSVEELMELLGDRVWRHAMVLFTWGWWLGARRVEEYIESEGEPLRWLLEKCGYRYHVLQFSKWDSSEVTALIEKVEDMVTRNRGHFGPLESRKDRSVRDTEHFMVGHGTSLSLLERPKGEQTFTAEEWNRREEEWKKKEEKREEEWRRREEEREEECRKREEMIDRMLEFVATEQEEPSLPAVRRRRDSMELMPPSMSGGAPSETGSSYRWSPDKVSDWLLKRHLGSTSPSSQRKGYHSSGYGTMSLTDARSVTDEDDSYL